MATTVPPRYALAEAIRQVLGAGVAVYPYPPEVVSAPAVVLVPRSPYRTDASYQTEQWSFGLLVLILRPGDTEAGYLQLDVLIAGVREAVKGQARAVWEGVDAVGSTVPVGGVEYLSANCQVTWHGCGPRRGPV